MRRQSGSIVTYRAGYNFVMGIFGLALVGSMLPVIAKKGSNVAFPLAAGFLAAFVALAWTVTMNPRVELHDTHVLVVTHHRKVGFSYAEIRSAELDGHYFMMGRLLRIVGRTDRVTVWPGGGSTPPGWQVQLQAELKHRIRSQDATPGDPIDS
ncbi:MAG: hypothetical protein GY720_11615 [bacterium]|nr:hypothetical protein [bacterium]